MIHGFLRVAAATPECIVGDCEKNTAAILSLITEASQKDVSLVVFPELCITGYTCADLFAQEVLGREAISSVNFIAERTKNLPIASIVGLPFAFGNARYNCAAVISGGKVHGIVPKTHIPNYGEFYELRHFTAAPEEIATPGTCEKHLTHARENYIPAGVFGPEPVLFGTKILFSDEITTAVSFAVEICEDLWVPSPPSCEHVREGALIIANLSASNTVIGKDDYRRNLVVSQSGRCVSAYIYANAGSGESTTDLVFAGHNIIAENGTILSESETFTTGLTCTDIDTLRLLAERRRLNTFGTSANYLKVFIPLIKETTKKPLLRKIDPHPFVPESPASLSKRCEEVLSIQAEGLAKRLVHTGCKTALIGLSGGLDSTLALLVTMRAFDKLTLPRKGIIAITMPGFGTTAHTRSNALKLAQIAGTSTEEISIKKSVIQHFKDIGHTGEVFDVTYENAQARERTQILMDKANMYGGLVIGTGDLSELALGWATYNGDHMSMYAVNASVPKTLVKHLVKYESEKTKQFSSVLKAILETPVSPELLPPENGQISQKTEHIIGPYELHDFFLYHCVRWGESPAKILFLAEEAFLTKKNDEQDGEKALYTRSEILQWLKVFFRRFFSQQFKRSCLPDGPKVGSVSLSPRGDWRMPSDASATLWLKELDSLE
ncbi:MAG TPA: NAD(+) synthase [Treponemataceae bacterium]|nr:NAD(+) synthase [Treponemataceae bacterium]